MSGKRIGLTGNRDLKIHNYHVLAAYKANIDPLETLNLDLLRAVSTDKKEEKAWTVLHLCGHKWCHSPDHLAMGPKVFNDEQTWCHRMLQSVETEEEYNSVRRFACKHRLRCWTVVYRGGWKDNWLWS